MIFIRSINLYTMLSITAIFILSLACSHHNDGFTGHNQGIVSPSNLLSCLPKSFNGFEWEKEPYLRYFYEEDNKTIDFSGVVVRYASPSEATFKVQFLDHGDTTGWDAQSWSEVTTINAKGCRFYKKIKDSGYMYKVKIGSLSLTNLPYKAEDVILRFLEHVDYERAVELEKAKQGNDKN